MKAKAEIKKELRLRLRRSLFPPDVALLRNGELDALALGQGDPRLGALTDNEDVRCSCSERALKRVLNMYDIETTNMSLTMRDNTSTAHVTTTSDHDDVASVERHEVDDLALLNVELDRVIRLDGGVGIADGAAVMSDDVRNALGAEGDLLDFAELVGGLFWRDTVDGEAALDVVKETEVLARLLDRNDIHETGGVGCVCPDLAVDLNQTLHDDSSHLPSIERVL